MSYKVNPNITAGFFVRLIAFAVDSMIIGTVSLFLLPAFGFFNVPIFFDYSLRAIAGMVVSGAYFSLFTYFQGATPGKFLMRVRVVDCSEKPGFANILYRETVGRFLNGLLFIGYFMIIFDKEHSSLADRLSDTRVVYPNFYLRQTGA